MVILNTIQAATNLCSGAKQAIHLVNQISNLDKDEKIVNLQKIIMQMDEDAVAILQENQELKRILNTKTDLFFDKGVFWGKDRSGPYCPKCWQGPQKTQAYLKNNDPNENESWVCTLCDSTHLTPEGQKRITEAHARATSRGWDNLSHSLYSYTRF